MRYISLMMLAISAASYAEDPFSCVDPDVADAFLGNSYQERGEYSTTIPGGFVPLVVPGGLSLVGSQTAGSMTTVVYKTKMDAEPALHAAVGAMAQSGWVENEARQWGVSGGFQTSSRPMVTVLCHDDEPGALSITAIDKSGRTFVSYVRHSADQSCADAPAAPRHFDPSEMMRLVPALKLPKGTKATNAGMGGNGNEVGSHVDISGAMGRSELQNFFEDQIRNQGWEFQTGWSSHISSGSVWTLDSAADGVLIGTLHLFDSGADPVRVRFSVNPADPTKGADHGSWSGFSS
jgi:hypothetical protein